MRVIKFKGIAETDGREVVGEGAYVTPGFQCVINKMIYVHCKTGSIKQLIGVDGNGCEVYEGDKVQRIKEWNEERADYDMVAAFPMAATFGDYTAINDGEIIKVE